MLRLGMILLGASFLMRSRSAAASDKREENAQDPDSEGTPSPTSRLTPQEYSPTLDPALNALTGSGSVLRDWWDTNPFRPSGVDNVIPNPVDRINPPPLQVGPDAQITADQLTAAFGVYRGVVSSVYPGFTQQWINTQRLASFQERALTQNLSVAKRAVDFHRRAIKKIFG